MAEFNSTSSFVEWGAVIAGSVLACAISLVLLQFGNAIDLSSHYLRSHSVTSTQVLLVGLWLFVVQLLASCSGGYLAGRMRAPWTNTSTESELRDGTHGLLVWATSTLLAVAVAYIMTVTVAAAVDHSDVDVNVSNKVSVIMAFGAAAGSIVSAVAAWWTGVVGGDHRDKGTVSAKYKSFHRK